MYLATLLLGLNLIAVFATATAKTDLVRTPGIHGGYQIESDRGHHAETRGLIQSITARSNSPAGIVRVWWPVATSLFLTIMVVAVYRTRDPASVLAQVSQIELGPPRVTIKRGMVVIASTSYVLWLMRLVPHLTGYGILILLLLLLAFRRRRGIATPETLISRAGLVGYSLCVFLAVVWIVCVLVGDAYVPGGL